MRGKAELGSETSACTLTLPSNSGLIESHPHLDSRQFIRLTQNLIQILSSEPFTLHLITWTQRLVNLCVVACPVAHTSLAQPTSPSLSPAGTRACAMSVNGTGQKRTSSSRWAAAQLGGGRAGSNWMKYCQQRKQHCIGALNPLRAHAIVMHWVSVGHSACLWHLL